MKNLFQSFMPAIIIIAIIFAGCSGKEESKLLDTTINKTNLPDIVKDLKNENILSSEDIMTINNGLNRIGANNPDTLSGMTVRNIFDLQKAFMNDYNYTMLNTTATRIAMNMNYDIKYLGVRPMLDTVNNIQGNTILYEFKNNTDKPIKTIRGMLQFFNSQSVLIKQFEIDNTQAIPANAGVQFYKAFAYNAKEPRDSIIRFHNAQLIVKWQPIILEFVDGRRIELEINN